LRDACRRIAGDRADLGVMQTQRAQHRNLRQPRRKMLRNGGRVLDAVADRVLVVRVDGHPATARLILDIPDRHGLTDFALKPPGLPLGGPEEPSLPVAIAIRLMLMNCAHANEHASSITCGVVLITAPATERMSSWL
jgi:hypothetical protein